MARTTLGDITAKNAPSKSVLAAPWPYFLAAILVFIATGWAMVSGFLESRQSRAAMDQAHQVVRALTQPISQIRDVLRSDAVQDRADEVRLGASINQSLLEEIQRLIPEATNVSVFPADVFVNDTLAGDENEFILLDMMAEAMDEELAPVQFVEVQGENQVIAATSIGRGVQENGFVVVTLAPAFVLNAFNVSAPAAGYVGVDHATGGNAPRSLLRVGGNAPAGYSPQRMNIPGSLLMVNVPQKHADPFLGAFEQIVLVVLGGILLLVGISRLRAEREAQRMENPDAEPMPDHFATIADARSVPSLDDAPPVPKTPLDSPLAEPPPVPAISRPAPPIKDDVPTWEEGRAAPTIQSSRTVDLENEAPELPDFNSSELAEEFGSLDSDADADVGGQGAAPEDADSAGAPVNRLKGAPAGPAPGYKPAESEGTTKPTAPTASTDSEPSAPPADAPELPPLTPSKISEPPPQAPAMGSESAASVEPPESPLSEQEPEKPEASGSVPEEPQPTDSTPPKSRPLQDRTPTSPAEPVSLSSLPHDYSERQRQPLSDGPEVELSSDIFRAYDIRGVVGESLGRDVARMIGQAVGSLALDSLAEPLVVGRDGRHSGPELVDGLIEGISSTGCNVIDVGAVPTGALYYAAYELGKGSGVMVTGSHNPPDYNGFKIMIGGRTLAGDNIYGLYERIRSDNLRSGEGTVSGQDVLKAYRQRIAGDIQLKRPLKVVVDCGNGIGGICAADVLRSIGAEVVPLFDEVDGDFPNHHPDPSEPENLHDLIESVRLMGADLGVAFDGDADRLGVVTPEGKIVFSDRVMMLFSREVLSRHPGETIIYDVKCTGHLDEVIREAGGKPEMYKTGHSLIKNRMKEVDSPFAGEMSGHFFFKDRWYGFDCGIYSACRLLEILSNEASAPVEVLNALPDSVSTPELKVQMSEGENHEFIERFSERAEFPGARLTTIDGLRADFEDGWGLVRASNTTPILVLRFDADSREALTRVQEAFRAQILAVSPSLELPF